MKNWLIAFVKACGVVGMFLFFTCMLLFVLEQIHSYAPSILAIIGAIMFLTAKLHNKQANRKDSE